MNILVRYLTQYDPLQSPRASRIIDGLSEDSPGFISLVALAETVWVLQRSYGLSGPGLAPILGKILQTSTFEVQNERQVFLAMIALESGAGAFSDALIAALDTWAGCTETVTFDRKAARMPTFRLA